MNIAFFQRLMWVDPLGGNITVEFTKNQFFSYWLKRCFEASKIRGRKFNP